MPTNYQRRAVKLLSLAQLYFGSALGDSDASNTSDSTVSSSGWPLQNFVTEPDINPPVFDINKTGTTADGYIFMDTNTNGASSGNLVATIIDDDGNLIWSAGYSETSNLGFQSYNGQDVITYWDGTISGDIGRGYGKIIIMDTSYDILYNVTLTEGIYAVDTYDSYIDAHESLISSDNTLLVTVYNTTQADLTSVGYGTAGWVLDSMIFELDIETSEVLWSWSASEHSDQIPYTASHEPIEEIPHWASTAWDYFHINSIEEYGDGYLISSRTLWSIFYIEKSTGNVIWTFNGGDGGNFTLPSDFQERENTGDQLFKYQHDARVASTTSTGLVLTLFDNNNFEYDNLLQPNNSYGLQITLNTDDFTSTLDEVIYDESDPVHTIAEGDRQTLSNGGTLINYGFQPWAKEFDSAGATVWSANWGTLSDGAYRARKFSFEGTPSTLPKIAVRPGVLQYHVYLSWNGATTVTRWEIIGCGENNLVTVANAGFETEWNGTCSASTVHAVALNGNGLTLAQTSSVVANTTESTISNTTSTL